MSSGESDLQARLNENSNFMRFSDAEGCVLIINSKFKCNCRNRITVFGFAKIAFCKFLQGVPKHAKPLYKQGICANSAILDLQELKNNLQDDF